MTAPMPAKISLIDEIKARYSFGMPSDIELKKFEKSAVALKSIEPENGYAALGILACIKGNEKDCRRNHEAALTCSGRTSIQLTNYANSLRLLRIFGDALLYANEAWTKDQAYLSALDVIIRAMYEAGIGGESLLWHLERWATLTGKQHVVALWVREDEEDKLDIEGARNEEGELIPWEQVKAELGL
jgi:hypothetical protein